MSEEIMTMPLNHRQLGISHADTLLSASQIALEASCGRNGRIEWEWNGAHTFALPTDPVERIIARTWNAMKKSEGEK